MQEQIPVKKSRPIFDQRSVFFSIVTLLLFSILVVLILRTQSVPRGGGSIQSSWSVEQMREYANRLRADGLVNQAASAFEEYLLKADVDGVARSKIYFSVGEMLLNANRYEDALSYFYKAEVADPDSELKSQIGSYIVTCLERLGRDLDAEYQLESRAVLSGEERKEQAPGEIVARIGLREITMGEINARLEKLPAWMKEEFTKNNEKKLEFIEHYVAHELLFDKGMKLGIHRDPEIRDQLQDLKKQLVIERVVAQEITGKVEVDPDDLKNYYEANKENYSEPAKAKFRHIMVDSSEKAQKIIDRLGKGEKYEDIARNESLDEASKQKGGVVEEWVSEGDPIPEIGFDEQFSQKLFELEANSQPTLIQSKKGFHAVVLLEKKAAQVKSFDEVEQQVDFDYRREKEARLTRELLVNLINSKEVQIYSDKFVDAKGMSESEEAAGDKAVEESVEGETVAADKETTREETT